MTQTQTKKFEKKERVDVWEKRRRLCGGKGEGCVGEKNEGCKREKEKVVQMQNEGCNGGGEY